MKRILALCAALLLAAVCLTGCGAQSKSDGYVIAEYESKTADIEGTGSAAPGSNVPGRKVIVTAEFSVEARDFSASAQKLEEIVAAADGYVERSDVSGVTEQNGYGYYVLRIPVEGMTAFSDALAAVGTVSSRTYGEEDITDEYYDVDARRAAKEAQRDRLIAMIDKAETLDELLRLEQELAEVQGTLDSLTGQQKRYDNQVAYATVSVRLWQKAVTQSGNTPYGPQVGEAFADSFGSALGVLKDLGIALIYMLPYLLIIAAVVAVILLATRKRRRARRLLREQQRAAYYASVQPQPPAQEDK